MRTPHPPRVMIHRTACQTLEHAHSTSRRDRDVRSRISEDSRDTRGRGSDHAPYRVVARALHLELMHGGGCHRRSWRRCETLHGRRCRAWPFRHATVRARGADHRVCWGASRRQARRRRAQGADAYPPPERQSAWSARKRHVHLGSADAHRGRGGRLLCQPFTKGKRYLCHAGRSRLASRSTGHLTGRGDLRSLRHRHGGDARACTPRTGHFVRPDLRACAVQEPCVTRAWVTRWIHVTHARALTRRIRPQILGPRTPLSPFGHLPPPIGSGISCAHLSSPPKENDR